MTTDVVMLTVRPDVYEVARAHLDDQGVAYRGILVNHSPEHIESTAQWTVLGDGENHSYAEGLNKAFEYLKNDRVLLLSDDANMRPGAFKAMLDHPSAIVGSVLIADGLVNHLGGAFAKGKWPAHLGRDLTVDSLPDCHHVDWVTWACVLIDRAVIEKVGPVDEQYRFSHEDVDYGLRAREAGFHQPMLCTDALVDHPECGVEDTPRTVDANNKHFWSTWIQSGRLTEVLA